VKTTVTKEVDNFLKRIDKDGGAIIHDGKLVRELVKKPQIKELRDKDLLYIGPDRKKKATIFYKKPIF